MDEKNRIIDIKAHGNKNLWFYFYVDLLITLENKNAINYSYTIDLIREINSKNESIEGKNLTKILLSKICIDLIENFSSMNAYSEEYDEELNNIKEKNEKIISENKKYFENNNIKLENEEEEENEDEEDNQYFIGYQIDKIYADIIISLIKNKKIENNYDIVINLLKQMDIENINITQEIYNKLSNTLDNNEIIREYKIERNDDIFNETKINFYYILIKYIFKNSLYIYHLNFFLETRKLILNILRNNKEIKDIDKKKEPIKERTNFVIRKLVDVDYFFENSDTESKKKLEIILEYYKEILFETKKDKITLIENMINTNQKIDDNLSKDYEIAENMHKKIPIIKYLYENDNKAKKKKKKTEKVMNEIVESWNNMEKLIREQKIMRIKADKRKLIYNYIKIDEENKNIFMKIFGEEIYDNFIKKNESLEPKNIKYEDKKQKNKEKEKEKEKNVEKEKEEIKKLEKEKEKEKEEIKKLEKEKEEEKEEIKEENININEKEKKDEIINEEMKYEEINSDELCDKPRNIINEMNSTKEGVSIEEKKPIKTNLINYENNNNIQDKENKHKISSFIIEQKMDISNIELPNNKFQFSYDLKDLKDLKAPEASMILGKPQREISDIPDLISSKFNTVICSNKIKDDNYLSIIYKDIHYGEQNLGIEYNQFIECKKDIFYIKEKDNEKYQNLIRFFEYIKEIEQRLNKEFEKEYMLTIKLDLIREKENINNNNIYNITAIYSFFDPLKKYFLTYKDTNILINKTNSNLQGFQFMLYDINCDKYKDVKYSYEECYKKNIKKINKDPNIIINDNDIYDKEANEYCIIEYIKTIGKTKYSADFIKILSNGYYIIGSQNILYIYDNKFLLISSLTTRCNDWVHSICERILYKKKAILNNNNDEIKILCCMNSCLGLLELNLAEKKNNLTFIETKYKSQSKKKSKKEKDQLGNTYNICIEMRENNYIMAGLRGAVYCLNFFGNQIQIEQIKFSDQSFKSGIKLNENIVALSSNRVVPGGGDKLIFYNVKSKNKNKIEIENYSFNMNEHNMSLITYGKKDSNEKILICACKKYYPSQKNGILLINPNLGENEKIKEPFYDTGDYEVYCFCPIFNKINKNDYNLLEELNDNFDKIIYIEDTVFFFVGGFDEKKQQGIIKLYSIIPGEKTIDTKIKFLQNIEFDDCNKIFNGFDVHIKCMIQSKSTGNIIVTCADGNIHLFTKPNLELYKRN